MPITNTTMMGALLRATGAVNLDSMSGPLKERFGPMATKNIAALKVAYEKTVVEEAKS